MHDVTITIDFQLKGTDPQAAMHEIADCVDELLAEAIAGGAADLGGDAEVLAYQVIVDD